MTASIFDDIDTGIPRDRWKRPLVVPVGGGKPVPYTRATTFIDCLTDKTALTNWKMRMVALGLHLNSGLFEDILAASSRDLDAICQRALEAAGGNEKRDLGTALHAATQTWDETKDATRIDPALLHDVTAYNRATADLTMLHIEEGVVIDDLAVHGTPDRIVTHDGRNYIADLKTGSYYPDSCAMQLAVYSRGVIYDHRTGTRTPLPDVDQDRGIVIHLPAGTATAQLHWVDLNAGWDACQLAVAVRAWRKRKDLTTPWPTSNPTSTVSESASAKPPAAGTTGASSSASAPTAAPATATDVAGLLDEIRHANTIDRLVALWQLQAHIWTDECTAAAAERKAHLTRAA